MSLKIQATLVTAFITVTACQPKASPSRAEGSTINLPAKIELDTNNLTAIGDSRKEANARALITMLADIEDIERFILKSDSLSPEEKSRNDQAWSTLQQLHKNLITQINSQCKIQKNQTRPDLDHLKTGSEFIFGSEFKAEGGDCPAKLSRTNSSQAKVINWDPAGKFGSFKLQSTTQSASEFYTSSSQEIMGMKKGELTMKYDHEAVIERDQKRRSFVRATGEGFIVLSRPEIGRMDLKYKGQELNHDGLKTNVVELHMVVNGEPYTFAFESEGREKRSLKKVYIGTTQIDEKAPEYGKILKLANRLSLSEI